MSGSVSLANGLWKSTAVVSDNCTWCVYQIGILNIFAYIHQSGQLFDLVRDVSLEMGSHYCRDSKQVIVLKSEPYLNRSPTQLKAALHPRKGNGKGVRVGE